VDQTTVARWERGEREPRGALGERVKALLVTQFDSPLRACQRWEVIDIILCFERHFEIGAFEFRVTCYRYRLGRSWAEARLALLAGAEQQGLYSQAHSRWRLSQHSRVSLREALAFPSPLCL